MNSISPTLDRPTRIASGSRGVLVAWGRAIGSLGPKPWKWATLACLFCILLDCTFSFADMPPSASRETMLQVVALASICWVLQSSLGLCAWAIADRVEAPAATRPRRLAVALFACVGLQVLLGSILRAVLFGHVDPCRFHVCGHEDLSKVPDWLLSTAPIGQTLIFWGLLFAWLEMRRRNQEIEARLIGSQQQRAKLQRANFEARLTAMQAQVDPQFLFESLADVQVAYERRAAGGTDMLDRLIAYLRTALPSLRSDGSTIGVEAELVGAWLDVVAARRDGRPRSTIDVAPDCRDAPFGATLLLPLVQWALGDLAQPPAEASLSVRRLPQAGAGRLQAQVRVAPPGPDVSPDDAPGRVRERLQALYGESAGLSVARVPGLAGADGQDLPAALVITLSWTDESADRNRR